MYNLFTKSEKHHLVQTNSVFLSDEFDCTIRFDRNLFAWITITNYVADILPICMQIYKKIDFDL